MEVKCDHYELVVYLDFETDFPLLFLPPAPPAVAFSVALMDEATKPGDFGPFAYRTVLPYRKVFANVGNGYNPSTGGCAPVCVSESNGV